MIRLIVDTDVAMGAPGSDIDDGFALALAHADPSVRVELITTVHGNTDVESATLLALELTHRLGITDVPVVKGVATPLTRPERRRTPRAEVTARYGLGMTPSPGYAPVAIADLVMSSPGEVTILAIGPLTNVAAAIALEPRLPAAVKEIVVMGGMFFGTMPSWRSAGEFNVHHDPEAAAAVLRCGARQRWVGLDVTLQVRLTRDHAARLSAAPGSFSRLAGAATSAWIDVMHAFQPGDPASADSCAMHDPLAVAALTRPDLLTFQEAAVDVVTSDGAARGILVVDRLLGAEPPPPNVEVATGVDAGAFMDYFIGALRSL
ncbi:MAG: nucleoside hydrolase [Dermatophilaceae bacterium]